MINLVKCRYNKKVNVPCFLSLSRDLGGFAPFLVDGEGRGQPPFLPGSYTNDIILSVARLLHWLHETKLKCMHTDRIKKGVGVILLFISKRLITER